MKTQPKKTLRLNKETLRSLSATELGDAAGGGIQPTTTVLRTRFSCHESCRICPTTFTQIRCTTGA